MTDAARAALKKGDMFYKVTFQDVAELCELEIIGRFHTEKDAVRAVLSYVKNELGGIYSDGFMIHTYYVTGEPSTAHEGWLKAVRMLSYRA